MSPELVEIISTRNFTADQPGSMLDGQNCRNTPGGLDNLWRINVLGVVAGALDLMTGLFSDEELSLALVVGGLDTLALDGETANLDLFRGRMCTFVKNVLEFQANPLRSPLTPWRLTAQAMLLANCISSKRCVDFGLSYDKQVDPYILIESRFHITDRVGLGKMLQHSRKQAEEFCRQLKNSDPSSHRFGWVFDPIPEIAELATFVSLTSGQMATQVTAAQMIVEARQANGLPIAQA